MDYEEKHQSALSLNMSIQRLGQMTSIFVLLIAGTVGHLTLPMNSYCAFFFNYVIKSAL